MLFDVGKIKAILIDLGDTLIYEDPTEDKKITEAEIILIDHAKEVLKELKERGYKIALVSNTYYSGDEEVTRVLDKVGLVKYFDAIVTSLTFGKNKPDPNIFLYALKKINAAPEEAVMIGNRIETDIKGAKCVGMKAIHFYWRDKYKNKPDSELEVPDKVIRSLKEVLKAIEELDC
jgi:putative hydrolase of the HAD superfamily